jgi:hypothetical protein
MTPDRLLIAMEAVGFTETVDTLRENVLSL